MKMTPELQDFLDSLENYDPYHYRWLVDILYREGLL